MSPVLPPDVLVLGAGAPADEAWMTGLLAGMVEGRGLDVGRVESLVGTGAGAVVAARLAAGVTPERSIAAQPLTPDTGAEAGLVLPWLASAPLVPYARALRAGGAARMRAGLLCRLSRPTRSVRPLRDRLAGLGARFDGRLRVACVDRSSGRRTMFGAPGHRRASVADAVAASCALPWIFRSVRVAGREHVAGAVWSWTNLDAVPAGRDTEVLVLDPTASLGVVLASARHAALAAARAVTEADALDLRRRGVRVRIVGPSRDVAGLMGEGAAVGRIATAAWRQGLTLGDDG